MGDMVIVAYRPKPGREQDLLALTQRHVPLLRRLGLATDRPAAAMRGEDGVILELFEWAEGAMAAAHQHPDVLALWQQFAAACDYVPLRTLPEAATLFARFQPLDL